jgi:hypothetical protein
MIPVLQLSSIRAVGMNRLCLACFASHFNDCSVVSCLWPNATLSQPLRGTKGVEHDLFGVERPYRDEMFSAGNF